MSPDLVQRGRLAKAGHVFVPGRAGLMERIGRFTAAEMIATGIYWNYAPVVAVPQDIRWGRTYEGYSENTDLVSTLAVAYLRGLQADSLADPRTVLATPKHFVGDGGTVWGSSSTGGYQIDQGVTDVDETTLRAIHLPPYQAVIEAGAMSIMVSYSSWGGMKMHADVVTSINAGIDMNMVPYHYDRFISTLAGAVEKGDVPIERIDDAVRRILKVKFELGLFENPFADESPLATLGSEEHRALARDAVGKSLVLLKNENQVLPLSKDASLIYVAGQSADDIGTQCGGWSIEWQGKTGDITPGTTILEAIQNTVSKDTQVEYNPFGRFEGTAEACIAVAGEAPYAEGLGDSDKLSLPVADLRMLRRLPERCNKLVVILISGRPLIVSEQLDDWDALVAAWLPGTEGQGVADVLFGDRPFSGKLPYTWPRSVEQLPFDFADLGTGSDGPLFSFGYGLEN